MTKHGARIGDKSSREYRSWNNMRNRCNWAGHRSYSHYGGRGIKVCERWSSFELFLEDMGRAPGGHSLDRIDVNGNYEPSNCRWASLHDQARNRRVNIRVEINGKSMILADWAEVAGITKTAMYYRVKVGWPTERLLDPPTHSQHRNTPRQIKLRALIQPEEKK